MNTEPKSNANDYLSKLNFHERDQCIIFDEIPHIYTVNGDSSYMSVTTFLKGHFSEFDACKVIENMKKGKNWNENNKYYNMTDDEIKTLWKENGSKSSSLGTNLHKDIEDFYNNQDINNDTIEFSYFKNFYEKHKHLKPYRTEWMVWDEELKIAGSIDMCFVDDKNNLYVYDWKRTKNITKNSFNFKTSHTECINHIPDTNFWKYSLQLNTYKAILEKKYNKKVKEMCLIVLHPNNFDYIKYQLPDLSYEVGLLFDLRKNVLKNNT